MMDVRRLGIAAFLFIGMGALSGCANSSGDIRPVIAMDGDRMNLRDPVENGRALLVTGQYGLAIDALTRALHDDPRSARTLTLLAEAYDRLHRYDLADRYHAEALQIDPNSVAALNNWGYSYLVRGDKARAVGLLERAFAVKGGHPVVAANLRLAAGDDSIASKDAAPVRPTAANAGDLRISDHVTAVRRSGKLVRIARGVQLLVTRVPATQESQVSSIEPQPQRAGAVRAVTFTSVFEPSTPTDYNLTVRLLAALQRILDPSPFKYFPEVDDFTRQWPMGSRPASGTVQSAAAG
ncbi:MAG: tetratricopeptide repeat protein [Dongiaceae bacterium]